MLETIQKNWDDITSKLKVDQELSDISFHTWIEPLKPVAMDGDEVLVLYPGEKFGLDYIQQKKYDFFLHLHIQEVTGLNCTVRFIMKDDVPQQPVSKKSPVSSNNNISSGLNRKYTFESFVVGSNNRMAHAASLAVAESPAEAFNPLFIYGGVGLGKTHLMHSIGNFILNKDPGKKVMYVTSEIFTNELIDSIRNKNNNNDNTTAEFRAKYRNNDVLLIDDIQFIIGKDSTQEEFFHTFNTLYQAKKQIIISSDRPPNEMELLEERLRSRFAGGLTVSISEPDYETRMAILRKKEADEGYNIDNEIIKYIATHVKSNIRELEGALTKIVAFSKLQNTDITLDMAAEILKDYFGPAEPREITPELIIQTVADHFHVSVKDLISPKRSKDIAYPRQIAMYLCKEMTTVPLIKIGNCLGNRDHATIIHGCEKIKKDLPNNDNLQSAIETLKKKINPPL
ncbi:MAG: chromosomal replication initiator protein DnaA [Lachnospiraceae bacterium]|nr:chromosomal replication initiator protein DnaA [Lachnospiraceae bacterium]